MARTIPSDPLGSIFTPEVVDTLDRARTGKPGLQDRLDILVARGAGVTRQGDTFVVRAHRPDRRAKRAAWDRYVEAAYVTGLFDEPDGRDLRARLTGTDDDHFRGAMAECLTAWVLQGKLGLAVSARPTGRPGHPLEMVINRPSGPDVHIEVKAPHHPAPASGVGYADRSDVFMKRLKKANRQFGKDAPNVLVLAPKVWPPVHQERNSLVRAFIGSGKIVMDIDMVEGGAIGPARHEFAQDGAFLKEFHGTPRYTRVSAALCIEEVPAANQALVEHELFVVHNPHAKWPLSRALFGRAVQFVREGDRLFWTDGASVI